MRTSGDWRQPPEEQGGARNFLELARERFWYLLIPALVGLACAIAYVAWAEPVYEAQANLLITPVPAEEGALVGLGLIPESNDPSLPVETAATVVATIDVAEQAASELDGGQPDEERVRELLDSTRAEPVGQSNIVAVVAEANSAEAAAAQATAFAEASVTQRTERLHERIDAVLPRLQSQIDRLPVGSLAADSLANDIAQLESLRAGEDPTIQFETPATPPQSPKWPRPVPTVLAGLLGGLGLGALLLLAQGAFDPRLRRSTQLRRLFNLPILARIPLERGARRAAPLGPTDLSAPAIEAYRTLRATLAPRGGRERGRVILITGTSPSEGKTTTAVNLAVSLALSGRSVILIDSDLRRPAVGVALDTEADTGVVSVLIEKAELEEALVTAPVHGGSLRLLLADYGGPGIAAELFSLPAARQMVDDARSLADYVIIDSPPLTEVIDALPLATRADDVLIVVRIDKTNLVRLKQLGDLLASNDITPAGFALVGAPRTGGEGESGYYYLTPGGNGARRRPLAGRSRRG